MESLEKPVDDRVLQAMAQAYPDALDLTLLSMVHGCDVSLLQAATARLVASGLAQAQVVADGAGAWLDAPRVTDRGMAVAEGLAADAGEANALLHRLEAQTLRALLSRRVKGSRLSASQVQELLASIVAVADAALVDAARVWAHQPVSDWRALIRVLLARPADSARPVAAQQ